MSKLRTQSFGSEDWTTLALKPVLLLVFAIVHIVYHLAVTCSDAWRRVHRGAEQRWEVNSSWQDVLRQHGHDEQSVKVPQHLGVILVETAPSLLRLTMYTLWHGARSLAQVRQTRHEAHQLKHAHDLATLIHLSRLSGVQTLTVFTPAPLTTTVQLQQILLDRYSTKTSLTATHRSESQDTSKRHHSSSSSSSSSAISSASSSGTETSAPSTLASSFTVDAAAHPSSIDLCIGPSGQGRATDRLQVVLLSEADAGADAFAAMVSKYTHQIGRGFQLQIRPDMAETASGARLRKAWSVIRSAKVSDLTVDRLDAHLLMHGYPAEPQLLIVYGGQIGCQRLYGMPAWTLRVSDLFFDAGMQSNLAYTARDYVAALHKHASSEQRHGR